MDQFTCKKHAGIKIDITEYINAPSLWLLTSGQFPICYMHNHCTIKGATILPKPHESMAQGGDFLIAAQSDFSISIGLYCDPISHSYC